MAKHRRIWSIRWMCEMFGVSLGGYCAWLRWPRSQQTLRDEQLLVPVRRRFVESDQTYGAPRVHHDLRAWGEPCSIHRVTRLMQQAGLSARHRRRRMPLDTGAQCRGHRSQCIGSAVLGGPTEPTLGS